MECPPRMDLQSTSEVDWPIAARLKVKMHSPVVCVHEDGTYPCSDALPTL